MDARDRYDKYSRTSYQRQIDSRPSATRRPSAAQQERRSRILAVIVVILFAVICVEATELYSLLTGSKGESGTQTTTNTSPEGEDENGSEGEGGEEGTEGEDGGEETGDDLDNLDERARELALDPTRETEWLDHSNGVKTVYLTFDDGPSVNTQKILDILDQYGAKATFFVTGVEPDYYYMIAEAYNRGHTIGMHTMTHEYYLCYASVDAYFDDLNQIAAIVKDQIGFVPYLIRFPGGASNTISANYCTGIMSTLTQQVLDLGYQYYDWNQSSGDASGNNVDVSTIVSSSCTEVYTNVILLMHDSAAKSTTVEALPQIIEWYMERGFVFEALDRSAVVVHHATAN